MTAPIWMAAPPEVHSTLLSSGPGPVSLLASAAAWSSLSEEYASVANELTAVVGAVEAGVWQGPSAEAFVAAYVPYLAWLMQASSNSAATAAQQETAATAYATALAAMPTLAELAANHASHAALVATNFFGINTIPIALNEADYARMWIQAATVMSTYQVVSDAAVAATPTTTPAPQVVKSNATADAAAPSDPPDPNFNPLTWLDNILSHFLPPQDVSIIGDPQGLFTLQAIEQLIQLAFNLPYPSGVAMNPFALILYDFTAEAPLFTQLLPQLLAPAAGNPLAAITVVLFLLQGFAADVLFYVLQSLHFFPLFTTAILALPLTSLLIAPVGAAAGGFAGLAGLAGLASLAPTAAVPPPVPALLSPVASIPPPIAVGPALSLAPVPTPAVAAPALAPAAVPAPGAPPPPPVGPGPSLPYLVGALGMRSRTSDQAKTHEPTSRRGAVTSAPAAASTQEPAPVHRRRRAKLKQLGRGYEYMDLDGDLDDGAPSGGERVASAVASDRGAGIQGFARTAAQDTKAAGLTTLAGDEFGGPRMPMLPNTWDPDRNNPRP